MAAVDDYDTALSAVATAVAAGEWSTARTQLLVARAHLARVPQSFSRGGFNVVARGREELDGLEAAVDKQVARTAPYEEHSSWVPE